ncbi:MAG: NAD(P)H-hydrate epimerase, partial [Acidovorax sp.]
MHPIRPDQAHPLYGSASTRAVENAAALGLPAHALMQRAGLAVARLAMALAPHAHTVWIACGPGNNGGDGLEAAMHLRQQGRRVLVTWLGQPDTAPADARASWQRAQHAGVEWTEGPPQSLTPDDLCIDALLGIGVSSNPPTLARPPSGCMMQCLQALQALQARGTPVLAVDVPSGLDAGTGQFAAGFEPVAAPPGSPVAPRYTLSLLTLKPGLFTASGRDAAGQVWFDGLGVALETTGHAPPDAWLSAPPQSGARL